MSDTRRTFALFGALLLAILLFTAVKAEGAQPTAVAPAVAPSFTVTAKQPYTIVAVTRCDKYETLYITFKDGSFTTVDVSKSDPAEVNNYVLQATHYGELQMDCTAVGHDSVR